MISKFSTLFFVSYAAVLKQRWTPLCSRQFQGPGTSQGSSHVSTSDGDSREFLQHLGMDQYLYIPFLEGWTSIYQLFWCELQGYKVLTHCHFRPWKSMKVVTCSPRFLCLLHLPCFTKPSLARNYVAMPGNALKCVQSHASQPGSGPSFSQQRWSVDPFFRPLQGGYAWEDGINIFIPTTRRKWDTCQAIFCY